MTIITEKQKLIKNKEEEIKNVFDVADFDQFFKKCCCLGKGSIWAEKLLRTYNSYRCGKDFSLPITSTRCMTTYLKKKGIEVSGIKRHGKRTYIGISLNDIGLSLIENNFRDVALLKARKSKKLSPNNSCKLISCNPTVLLMRKIVSEYNQTNISQTERINLLKTKKILKNIEKLCFQKNWNPRDKTKIGLALYLTSNLSFEQFTENFGISNYTPRSFKNKIEKECPEALERLFRYSKVYSRNPNCLEKIRKKILFWHYREGYSIHKITKLLRGKGYKVKNIQISKKLVLWS